MVESCMSSRRESGNSSENIKNRMERRLNSSLDIIESRNNVSYNSAYKGSSNMSQVKQSKNMVNMMVKQIIKDDIS